MRQLHIPCKTTFSNKVGSCLSPYTFHFNQHILPLNTSLWTENNLKHTHTHFHKRSLVFWSGLDQNVSHRAHKDLDKHWKTGFHNRQIQSYEKPFRSMLTWTVLTFDYFPSKICNPHRSAEWAVDGSEIILQHLWIGLKTLLSIGNSTEQMVQRFHFHQYSSTAALRIPVCIFVLTYSVSLSIRAVLEKLVERLVW